MSGQVKATSIIACGDGGRNNFIIDGHHRWSSALVANPDAQITVSFIKGDNPFEILAISQVAIATYKPGKLPSAKSQNLTNLLAMDAASIKKYCMSNVGKVVDKNAGAAFLTDDVLDYLAGQGYGGTSSSDDRETKLEKICEQIAQNCTKVPRAGEAPERKDMPQFDPSVGGPSLGDIKDKLTGGTINFKTPITGTGNVKDWGKEKQQVTADSWDRQGAVVVERWQRLAGLVKG